MDKTAMQNIFLYGNNAMGGAPPPGATPTTPGDNNSQNNQAAAPNPMYPGAAPGTDPSAQVAMNYPVLSMGYFNQGPAAAHAHAAAAMAEQRLAGYNGQGGSFPSYDAYGQAYGGGAVPPDGAPNNGGDYSALLQRFQQPQGATNWMNYGAAGMHHLAPSQQPMDPHAPENGYSLGPWSTTSAGLLGKMNPEQDKKKAMRKKHKDKPKRPLSAYNIFFKEERARILESIPSKKKDDEEQQADEPGEKKGRKRKKTPHGKIGFENLAKIIGQRWQELKEADAEKYKKLAAEDMKRYKEQMEVFLTKLEEEKKKKEGYTEEKNDESEEPDAKRIKAEESEETA